MNINIILIYDYLMMSPIQIIFFTQNCVLSKKSDDIILS